MKKKGRKFILLKDCAELDVAYNAYDLDYKKIYLDENDKVSHNFKLENIAKRSIIKNIKNVDIKMKLFEYYNHPLISKFYVTAEPYLTKM